MRELPYDWPEICVALMWQLAPNGLVLYPQDLDLPREKVGILSRNRKSIRLAFIDLETAERAAAPALGENRATVTELRGRWKQITWVMLWKLAKSGTKLTQSDFDNVPGDKQLLCSGHPDGVEWRFLPWSEAQRIHEHDLTHEGTLLREKTHL